MNLFTEARASLAGVVTAVPNWLVDNDMWPDAKAVEGMTGVRERRFVSSGNQYDLALAAAQALMARMTQWPVALVYVTQTPGRLVPATAYEMHAALELPPYCLVVPLNYSCAGYVSGLFLAMTLAEKLGGPVLLIAGDASSRIVDEKDRATAPLFGDAVSASWIRPGGRTTFRLGNDGHEGESLSQANDGWLHMVGADVFRFATRRVPPLVQDLAVLGEVDAWLFHQANLFMIRHLVKRCELGDAAVPTNIDRFGNTSSASIPLLLCDKFTPAQARCMTVNMVGFGAGWAWAGARVELFGIEHLEVRVVQA